jgi:hypothetical protein
MSSQSNPQINLIYVADTGHVLALFTRAAAPTQPEKQPDTFVGDGLHVRGIGDPVTYADDADFNTVEFVVPAAKLKLLQTDFDPNPPNTMTLGRDQYVDSNSNAVSPFTSGHLTVAQVGTSPSFKITLPAIPTSPGNFVLLVQPTSASATTQYSTKPLSLSSVDNAVDLSALPSGNYHVLALVPLYPAMLVRIAV